MKNILHLKHFLLALLLGAGVPAALGQSISYNSSFDLTNGATFDDNFLIGTELTVPTGIAFNPDGTKMFVCGQGEVNQYTLTIPFEVSSGASFDESPLDISGTETTPEGIAFNTSGTRMFIVGASNLKVFQFNLNSAFDITAGVTAAGSFDFSGNVTTPTDIAFNPTGSKMYVTGLPGYNMYQYSLSNSFDVSTGVTYNGSYSLTYNHQAQGFAFSTDGYKMFAVSLLSDQINQYSLSSAFDITSTVTKDDAFIDISGQDLNGKALAFSADGTLMFMVGDSGNDINQYDLHPGVLSEASANNGSIDQTTGIRISGKTFANAGGTLSQGTHFTISNLPAGFSPSMAVAAGGKLATLSLSGKATAHQDANDVSSLTITFTNAAFVGGNAAGVANAVGANSGIGINFVDNKPYLTHGNAFDPTGGMFFAGSLDISSEGTSPEGVEFSSDGMTLFVVNNIDLEVNQYSLSSPYHITSGVSHEGAFDFSGEALSARGLRFNQTGSRLFVLDANLDEVEQYTLTTPWDVTGTVTHNGTADVGEEGNVTDLDFSYDGSRLFIIGTATRAIHQYSLATPFDITTGVTYDGSPFSVSDKDTNPYSLDISSDGRRIFVAGNGSDDLHSYLLGRRNDITSDVTYEGTYFDFNTVDSFVMGFTFNKAGDHMFAVGVTNDKLYDLVLKPSKFYESSGNNGSLTSSAPIYLADDQFTHAGGTLTHGFSGDYFINNLPAGLTPIMTIAADGQSATLSFNGQANDHQNVNDVADLSVLFNNSAFESGNAAAVVNSNSSDTNLSIDFFDNNEAVVYNNAYDLSNGAIITDIHIAKSGLTGLAYNDTGTKLYVLSSSFDDVTQYTLSSPYDISTGVVDGSPFSVLSQDATPTSLAFSNDGSKMFIAGQANDNIYQYNLSVPFDITTTPTLDGSFGTLPFEGSIEGITFNSDGTMLFFVGTAKDHVYSVTLSSPFDLTLGATISSSGFNVSNEQSGPNGLSFSPDGLGMFISGAAGISQYKLLAPYDLSQGASFEYTSDIDGSDLVFLNNGTTVATPYSSAVTHYQISNGIILENDANTGTVSGSFKISLRDDLFTSAGGTLTHGVDYTITGVPSGLSPQLAVAASGSSAELTFSGKATNHQNEDDVSTLQFTFANAAFANSNAADVANAVSQSVDIVINFFNNYPTVVYGEPFNFSSNEPDFAGSSGFLISQIHGISFNHDGSKMFVVSDPADAVTQYTLSTPYDPSSFSSDGTFSVAGQLTRPYGMAFSADGDKLFVVGTTGTKVNQYSLTTPFVITENVTFDGSFNTTESSPQGVTFNPTGSKMYIIGYNSDAILQYSLEVPFDVTSGVSLDGTSGALAEDGSATDLAFSPDGMKVVVLGSSNDAVFQYNLTSPFDITAGLTYSENSFSVGTEDTTPGGIAFNRQMTKMFVAGLVGGDINVYNLHNADSFLETASNDGSLSGTADIRIFDDKFTNTGGSFTYGDDFSVNNLPQGLSAAIAVAADGKSATLTLSGIADEHQKLNDISSLEITFENTAFAESDAASVFNSTAAASGVGVDFVDNKVLSYGNAFNLEHGAVYKGFRSMSPENYPQGISMSPDGTRAYIVGKTYDRVYQYNLSVANDLSSWTTAGYYSVQTQEYDPTDVTFSADGTKMFVSGINADKIHQYSLSNPFDITSGTRIYDGGLSILNPQGIAFGGNGRKLYIIRDGGTVQQMSLANPYNVVSGVTSDGSFSVTAQNSGGRAIAVSADGSRLFEAGWEENEVHQYSTSSPFDFVSNISYDGIAFDTNSTSGFYLTGMCFTSDGKKLVAVYEGVARVHYFDLPGDFFHESANNDGSINGHLSARISGDTFSNAGGTLTYGADYTIAGVPAGLNPVMAVGTSGTGATLTFTDNAASHQDADDVGEIDITFNNSAFTSGDVSDILGTDAGTGVGIDFRDNEAAISYGNSYNIDYLPENHSSMDVSADVTNPYDVAFSSDGLRLFTIGTSDKSVHQYNLTTPFDIRSGVSHAGSPLDVSGEEPNPYGLTFNNDGSRLFVTGDDKYIHQYTLSSAFNITTGVTYNGASVSVGEQEGFPIDLAFNANGSKMYILGISGHEVNQFSLSAPFDVTAGISFDGNPFTIVSEVTSPKSMVFSANGTRLFILGSSSDRVYQYKLSAPFDITLGGTVESNFYVGSLDNGPSGLAFDSSGKRLFIAGLTNDAIFQFDIDEGGFMEAGINEGSVEGSINITLKDEVFTNAEGILSFGSDYTISALPNGLTPILSVAADGYSAILTLSGKAANHQNTDNIASLEFSFFNSAFEGGNASVVENATNATAGIGINFRDNLPAVFYGDVFDVSKAVSAGTPLDVSTQDSYPTGIAFNDDGTKMFISGNDNSLILQYTLSTPYNVTSGATPDGSYNVSAEDEYPEDLAFSADGMRMFVLGDDNYTVYQYNLSTPFIITAGVTYSGHSVNVDNDIDSPYALAFNTEGTKMYVGGSGSLSQYGLSASFDLSSGAVNEGALALDGGEAGIQASGIAFSPDGRFLLISEVTDYGIMKYRLSAPFDITQGATFDGESAYYDLDADGIYPSGLTTNPAGSRIFITDGENARIAQYNIDLGSFTEAASNDGTIEGSMNVNIVDDTFTSPGGTLASGSAFTITNLPTGLVPSLAVAADGYSATLSFTGKASIHQDATDISGLIFTFTNSAFANSSAADVDNAINTNSDIGIDFLINTENDILEFVLTDQVDVAEIDDDNHTVTMEVNAGISLTSLVPTITLSDGATSDPVSGMSQNFTSAVSYTVAAEDGSEQVWEVTITEQQVVPTDIELSEQTIDENNSIGDVLGTFSSNDGNTSQTHLYTFVAGEGDADNGSFQIDDDALKAVEVFDFETKSEYLIRVQTDDQNGGLFEKALVITINDVNEIPTDIALDNTDVDESNPVGTLVGTLSTTDEDNGQSHLYSLVSGTGDEGNSSFAIDGNQLKTAVTLDFETQDTYSIRIETDDQNGGTLEEVFTISVSDLPAQVTALALDNQSVMENLEAGAVVGNLTTTGEDLSGSYTYTLVSGTGDANNSLFGISGSQLVTTAMFDFEAANSYSVRIKTNDGNGNTLEKAFTISVGDEAESSDANILTFVLAEQAGDAVISNADHTVAVNVVFGTDITALTPEITISAEATMSPASGAAQDFTNAVVYTVTAEEGNTQEWTVTVTIAPNTANNILTFVLAGQTGDAVIDAENHTVGIGVPYGTDLTALTPTITVSEQATIDPTSETAVDFSSAVVYTVTAGDGSTQEWTVTVTPAMNSATDILAFVLTEQTGDAVIDTENHTVSVTVATGTDAAALAPTITVSEQATISPASGAAQNFSAPVTYTVTAGDDTTQEWTVTVTVEPAPLSSARDILTFSLPEETGPAVIDATAHTVGIEVAVGTDATSLVPTITVSEGASVNPASGVAQDFTSAVTYTVTAEDGSTQSWAVTVTVAPAPSSAKDIISFLLHEQTGDAVINTTDHTVTIEVEVDADITSLSPAITVSDKASVSPGSEVAQDFSAAVVYTVTAEDGSTQEWTVTVTVEEGTKTGIPEVFANLSVYPNPTVDKVHISGLVNGTELRLINLSGTVLNQVSQSLHDTESISLAGLTEGVYVLQVSTEGKVKSFRIIKN